MLVQRNILLMQGADAKKGSFWIRRMFGRRGLPVSRLWPDSMSRRCTRDMQGRSIGSCDVAHAIEMARQRSGQARGHIALEDVQPELKLHSAKISPEIKRRPDEVG